MPRFGNPFAAISRGRHQAAGRSVSSGTARDQGRPGPRPGVRYFFPHSVAGQVLLLQLIVVLLLIAGALAELGVQAHDDITGTAQQRAMGVAQTFAGSADVVPALASPDPTAILQPKAEAAMQLLGDTGIQVISAHGVRVTDRYPYRIGTTVEPGIMSTLSRDHPNFASVHTSAGGQQEVARVPLHDDHGTFVGWVAASTHVSDVNAAIGNRLRFLAIGAAGALVVSALGTALIGRRLSRQTKGLGPGEMTRMYEHHDAVLHAVREGVVILDSEGRVLLANDEARRLLDLPADCEGRQVADLGLDPPVAALLGDGDTVTDQVVAAGERLLAVNIRSTEQAGSPPGSVATLRDTTELRALSGRAEQARERLRLVRDAGRTVGTTLDVTRTAQELTEAAVPRFADFATVDLAPGVVAGEEPTEQDHGEVVRVAIGGIRDDAPFYPLGRSIAFDPATPQGWSMGTGHSRLESRLTDTTASRELLDYGVHSLIAAPLLARGILLGVVEFWRTSTSAPFEEDDRSVAEELAARAGLCIDNARRYTREHTLATTLQRRLLPHGLPPQPTLDVAHRYLPAQEGAGGDWYDVIPLPGTRVALVVGDVVGHGIHAAATMGRLRTAVHNFSALDIPPDELIAHLDELVHRIDEETPDAEDAITGATCLYAIYDPTTGTCTMTTAGHPPPVVVHPDGTAHYPDIPQGHPLGLTALPYETTRLHLPPGSLLVLYTDGLVESRDRDIDTGLRLLRDTVAHPGRTPEQTCAAVLDRLLPAHQRDDIALLVARTRTLPPDNIAEWDVPQDPAAVAGVRAAVNDRLDVWGIDEPAFATELILSELVTNAIRYGGPPIRVRLIRDTTLVCEVSDGTSTAPHLRYAATTDEGGRGLFLVAQLANRWGTRYTETGKIIWSEQALAQT
ncbi:SpoIIE family protein phosphatase [Kitasatospora griseola]|uniref:SpoIIE family protein phosphatase n=1 Tax=Kitasatospora griseola TaxID=2064 RepID=UPI00380DE540